jgi:hypothetical protein
MAKIMEKTSLVVCLTSIYTAAARFAIRENWRGTHQTALDNYAYWVNLGLSLAALDAAVRAVDPDCDEQQWLRRAA